MTKAQQQATIEAAKGSPRLEAGEKIRVIVYGEASLSGDYQIDPSGYLSLPLAGTVKAAGLTQAELEQELAKKFRSEYLRNPRVTVNIMEFRPFYILGELKNPVRILIPAASMSSVLSRLLVERLTVAVDLRF